LEQEKVLKSTFDSLSELEMFVDKLIKQSGLDEEAASRLQLVMSEACTNAIMHGNKLDESKKVHIHATSSDNQVIVKVTDEGKGFDPDKVPDPLSSDNLLKTSGRGVYLIRQYADEVVYSDRGNELTFTIKG
jgi:serine/threonine-protein kinase RsbW